MNRYNSNYWNASNDFKVTKGMVEEPIFIDQFIHAKLEAKGFKKGTQDYKQVFDSVMRVSKYEGKYYDKNEVIKNINKLIEMNQDGKKYIESQKNSVEFWQMTKKEYEDKYGKLKTKGAGATTGTAGFSPHKSAVEVALNMGKNVPDKVLADYPDLKR